MSYRIKVPPEVRKEINALPGYVRAQARQLIRALGQNPRPARAQELRGKSNIYRIWLATKWRIAYEVDDDLKCLWVLRVRRKEQMDYESLEPLE